MKKLFKYGLLSFVAFVTVIIVDTVIGMKMVNNYLNYIVVYEGEQYERLEDWSLNTEAFTEVKAFVGDVESKKKEPNATVRLIDVGDTSIISATVHKAENLYIKKGEKLKTSYDTADFTSAEILIDGRYIEISNEMKNKLIEHFKNYPRELPFMGYQAEHEKISPIMVKYKNYPELVHNMGYISKFQDNFIFIPSGQERDIAFGDDYIPIPFDPLSQDTKNQYSPILENAENIKEIRLISPRYDKKINPKYYADIVKHVNENCEKSYLCSGDNNILGDIIVSFKDGSENKKIGMLMYDNDDNFCLSDVRLTAFDKYRWVYPFPFKIPE